MKKVTRVLSMIALVLAVFYLAENMLRPAVKQTSAPVVSGEQVEMIVLMYHSINSKPSKSGDFVITPQALESDLKYLSEQGYHTVVMADLISFVREGKALPEKPIMITFDDGYYNNYLNAYPLLKKYNMKAVISIIGIESDRFTENKDENENYSHLTWDKINEMMASGVIEFQNHSYNMHKPGNPRKGASKCVGESCEDYRYAFTEDAHHLQERFEEMTGYVPTTYTYPFGSVSAESYCPIVEEGFIATLDARSGIAKLEVSKDRSLYRIPRYNRPNGTSAQSIIQKATAKKKK